MFSEARLFTFCQWTRPRRPCCKEVSKSVVVVAISAEVIIYWLISWKGFHHNEVGATLKYKNYYWNYHLIIKFEIGMKGTWNNAFNNGKSLVKKVITSDGRPCIYTDTSNNVIMFIGTFDNAWYNQVDRLIGTPYLSRNILKNEIMESLSNAYFKFSSYIIRYSYEY